MIKCCKKRIIIKDKEINYDELADAIVSAEEKREKKKREEEKLRKPVLKVRIFSNLMRWSGYAMIVLAAALCMFSLITVITMFKLATFGLFLVILGKSYYIIGKTDDAQIGFAVLSFLIALLSIVVDVLT